MKKIFYIVFCLFYVGLNAQIISKDSFIIVDKDSKEVRTIHFDALPYYNFGKGVGITSPDSLFQVNIRFRMQNRFEADFEDSKSVQYKAVIRRLRLRFDGYVGNPKFLYAIQLSFAPDDVGVAKPNEHINIIRDAMVFYRATNKFSIGFGQTKLPGNRQRLNSSGALDLTDRSINNAMFNIDRDFGFQAIYANSNKTTFGYNLKGAISTGDGRNFNKKTDGLAYTGRLELYPLGAFKKNGAFFEGDIQREITPKIYLGTTYHYNHNAMASQGQRGSQLYQSRNLQSIFIDGMMKYNGWTATCAYMQRSTNNPLTYNSKGEVSFVKSGYGYDTQLSYINPSNWEFIGRFSSNHPDKEIRSFQIEQRQYSFGITKYIWEHAFKAQFEVGINDYIPTTKKDDWYMRFQVEIGI